MGLVETMSNITTIGILIMETKFQYYVDIMTAKIWIEKMLFSTSIQNDAVRQGARRLHRINSLPL